MRRLKKPGSIRPAWITGLAVDLPERVLTNAEIERGMPWLETSAQWIEEHVGIRERRIAAPDQFATDLALAAARRTLEQAGIDPGEIDMVLHATNTPEESFPAGAARIQTGFGVDEHGRLRMHRAGCLDVQQGCAGFLGALRIACGLVASGEVDDVLVTGADVTTRAVDWADRSTCILFGDAGCAALVTSREPGSTGSGAWLRYLAGHMQTDGSMADSIVRKSLLPQHNSPFRHLEAARRAANGHAHVDPDGTIATLPHLKAPATTRPASLLAESESPFITMNGRDVYRFVKRTLVRNGYVDVMRRAGLLTEADEPALDQIERLEELPRARRVELLETMAARVHCLIPHNANLNLNLELAEQMRIPLERTYLNIARYGNTSAPSIGIAMYEALHTPARYQTLPRRDEQGEIAIPARDVVVPPLIEGQVAVLLSFGAGNSWNYVVVRHDG